MNSFELRIREIHRQYLEIVCPFIIELETDDCEYPVEIMNEIRAIETHFARANLTENDEIKNQNIIQAEHHIKRAILDCFKYSCLSLSLKHKQLRYDYRNADLHLIDNGKFLAELSEKEKSAKNCLIVAKKAELSGKLQTDELYQLYEKAYQSTASSFNFLEESLPKLEFAQSVADKNKKSAFWGFIVGILGLVVGIVSFIYTIR